MRSTPMRRNPRQRYPGLALGAMLISLALALAACGSSSKPKATTTPSSATGTNTPVVVGQKDFAGAQLLSQLYGKALAAKGFKVSYKNLGTTEQQLYNLKFKTVKKLDAGGPITNKALKDGSIDVGLLFTGSSVIDPDFVLLTDDKGLQPADNAIAVWRTTVDSPAFDAVINAVNAKLDTAAYNEMALKI